MCTFVLSLSPSLSLPLPLPLPLPPPIIISQMCRPNQTPHLTKSSARMSRQNASQSARQTCRLIYSMHLSLQTLDPSKQVWFKETLSSKPTLASLTARVVSGLCIDRLSWKQHVLGRRASNNIVQFKHLSTKGLMF